MILKKILNPALHIMNLLSFKSKIIGSISILFMLLIFPSHTIFLNNYEKNTIYKEQLIGLEYIQIIHKIIQTVQVHRGECALYLNSNNSNKNLKDEIKEEEELLGFKTHSLFEYDSKRLKILNSNQNFTKAMSQFELIKVDKLIKDSNSRDTFREHNDVIKLFQEAILDISAITLFDTSKDLRINYLANMLQDKLLNIYEHSGQLQGLSSPALTEKSIINEQKKILFSLYTELSGLKSNLTDNKILTKLSNYPALQKQTTSVADKLKKILKVIDNDIILNQNFSYNVKSFSKKVTEAMHSQEELYKMFIYTYKETIKELQLSIKRERSYLVYGFLIIMLISLYIFIAFYQSITGNLKKLQTASELISKGKTDIHLDVQKNDEIGDALLAFNTMSDELTKNISFLDGYKTAIDNSSIVSKTDLKGIITYANQMFCDISGYTQKELIGSPHNIIRHPDVPKEAFQEMWDTIQNKKVWKGMVKNKKKDGGYYIVNATVLPILDNKGGIREYVAVRHDITELEDNKEEIKKQRIDLLTGIANRNQLLEDLKTAIKPIICYLNIDDFSGFNDFYGKTISDNTLIRLADILSDIERNRYRLYKLEADQFILLFEEGYLSRDNLQYFFEDFILDIETKISNPEREKQNQNRISISLTGGAATYYVNEDYQKLILYSNIARKKAQQEHQKFLLFHHSMRKSEDYAHNIEWIKRIKEAINDDRIVCYYQPIFNNKQGNLKKYESLVRLIDKDGQAISPFFFLEIAKRAKLYDQITKIVIDKTFDKFRNIDAEFSINLTIDDILSEKTTNYIYQKLEGYPNTSRVIFEITESQEVADYKLINKFIKYVKQYSVKIAIDDFGSGYANFEHILNIDADFIKIDGSLIKNIHTDENSYIITEAIINFSKKLGRETIAEFIHNEEVQRIVKNLGADYSQGFYLGVPSLEVHKD